MSPTFKIRLADAILSLDVILLGELGQSLEALNRILSRLKLFDRLFEFDIARDEGCQTCLQSQATFLSSKLTVLRTAPSARL